MENLEGKRLLLLGGSLWKDVIKDFAKKNGIILIATGNDQNAGIFDIADECYDVDSTDGTKMKELIQSKNIDGVYMGGSEPVISSACDYLNELNLPCYCTKNQWEQLQNKENFKNLCVEYGLPVAKKYDFYFDEKLMQNTNIDFPVITKPSDGSGSNGFSICNNLKELRDGYDRASVSSPTGSVIVEKFVKNDGLVVFYTFSNGEMFFSGIEDKYPVKYSEQGSYVAGLLIFESNRKNDFRLKFENNIKRMFESLSVKEGTIWIEVFLDEENYYFNEVGYRYGGSVSIYPVDYFYKINQVAADIYFALTGKSCIQNLGSIVSDAVPKKENYGIYAVHLNSGVIKDIMGVEKIRELDNIIAIPERVELNDTIVSSGSVSQVFSFIHFVFDSLDECKDTIEKIHEHLSVIDENGNNMIARLLDISSLKIRH